VVPQDIEARLDDRPFVPFRIHTSDGRQYDIVRPENILIGLGSITIAIPQTPGGRIYERTVQVSLFHVVRIEPLVGAANGQSSA